MQTSYTIGARVIHKGNAGYGFGVVRFVEDDPLGEPRLHVAFEHRDNLVNLALEEVQIVPDALVDAKSGNWGLLSAFKRKLFAGLIIGENNVTGGFTKSAVRPLPHQAFLLDKILGNERFGHVLADDVGLGKTIEAGLIITCLMRRDPPQRILIICPAGLALQWQEELDEHFGLNFTIMGTNFVGKFSGNWRNHPLVIAPLDSIKREEYQDSLKGIGVFDLVVCDEAHRLTARRQFLSQKLEKTANYRLFEFLIENRLIRNVENDDQTPRSPKLLLLSATPHQGDDERFLHLLHLARPDLFDLGRNHDQQFAVSSLVETLTRTPKSLAVDWDGMPLFKGHTTRTLDVRWTTEELAVSRCLTKYIIKSLDFARESDRGTQLVVQLVMHTFHKIAASSWSALKRALERRLDAVNGKVQKLNQIGYDLIDVDDGDDIFAEFVEPNRAFFENEQGALLSLIDKLTTICADSKWVRCQELFGEINEVEPGAKVLIFTQYRVTQEMLKQHLQGMYPGERVEVIHGGVELLERQSVRNRFENDSRFLVSTEAGGEGVNLQKACHVMVNYDLPWNPMRLQQRIGRLDRYGQKKVVRVFNLSVPDSWDQHISTRILERLNVIQKTMNLASAGFVEDYKEMILGDISEAIDVGHMFGEACRGQMTDDAQIDELIQGAVKSVDRWRKLFSSELGMGPDTTHLKPTLGSEDFKEAFRLACEAQGILLKETRNSRNQYVANVFHFDLPASFRDPLFRPSRTVHVAFDRDVYASVRGVDLGLVRGQIIKPVLCGFGEAFTDWAFQSSMNARENESAFSMQAPDTWLGGAGWLFVFALKWLGNSRRLDSPDALFVCFAGADGKVVTIVPADAVKLKEATPGTGLNRWSCSPQILEEAKGLARERLREIVASRAPGKTQTGMSLLACAFLE